jgi:hypothetical protein
MARMFSIISAGSLVLMLVLAFTDGYTVSLSPKAAMKGSPMPPTRNSSSSESKRAFLAR